MIFKRIFGITFFYLLAQIPHIPRVGTHFNEICIYMYVCMYVCICRCLWVYELIFILGLWID